MDSTAKPKVGQCKHSYYELATDVGARKLHLPVKWLVRADACYRNYAFTAASVLSWCQSHEGRSFDPRIDQIAARSGLRERVTRKHLAALATAGVIERTRKPPHPTKTAITNGFAAWKDRNAYLEIPVAVVMAMGAAKVGLIARCTMAALMNRCTLAERLIERGDGTVEPDGGFTLSAIGRKVGVRPCRVELAVEELGMAGFPVNLEPSGEVIFEYETEIWYPCNHDTRIDYKQWSELGGRTSVPH